MAARQQQQGHQAVAPALQPVALRVATPDDHYNASRDLHYHVDPNGFPIPRKANKVEETVWEFKETDKTGLVLGDLLKRIIFHQKNLIGDKRREILKVLPARKKNRHHLTHLGNELHGLMSVLRNLLSEFTASIANVPMEMPEYFKTPPKLDA